MSDLKNNIRKYVSISGKKSKYDDVLKHIKGILDDLAESDEIALGNDKDLTGAPLEVRTKIIFEKMGFEIREGRLGLEDFVVQPPPNVQQNEPIVLEVKSSRKQNIDRDNLRQLDDWVFDLSGEEKARKEGLGGGPDPMALASEGLLTSKKKHPFPHKGVMIFNGPIGEEFDARKADCINPNDVEFVVKRNFCIIPLPILIAYAKSYTKNVSIKETFLGCIHKTTGILDMPI